jgi:hypothetical protein
MPNEWQDLTNLTGGNEFVVEKVRIPGKGIALEGSFELPPLARLQMEDQVFVMAFVRCHGSIKQMEQIFGVSYPTIKNRLNRIGEKFEFVDINPAPPASEVIDRLASGELSVEETLERLSR